VRTMLLCGVVVDVVVVAGAAPVTDDGSSAGPSNGFEGGPDEIDDEASDQ